MMKKYSVWSLVLAFCFCFAMAMPAFAVDTANIEQIPDMMKPCTVLLYDSDCKMFVINDGSDAPVRMYSRTANPANEPISDIVAEEKLVAKIMEEAETLSTVYLNEKKVIKPNTIVIYGTDGYINHIYPCTEEYLKEYASDEYQTIDKLIAAGINLEYGIITAEDVYVNDADFPKLNRGVRLAPNNYIIDDRNSIRITSNFVMGTGRLTTFSDVLGENGTGDPNKAGDCATRRNIDNAPYHQSIHVRNLDNNIDKYLRKNDNGTLPSAVLDIYKWDGVMMGETYSKYFTFENGRYYYEF